MSAGRKAKSEKSLTPRQSGKTSDQSTPAAGKDAAASAGSSKKSGFAPGTYYRQGVLVPGGPHKGPMPRSRSR